MHAQKTNTRNTHTYTHTQALLPKAAVQAAMEGGAKCVANSLSRVKKQEQGHGAIRERTSCTRPGPSGKISGKLSAPHDGPSGKISEPHDGQGKWQQQEHSILEGPNIGRGKCLQQEHEQDLNSSTVPHFTDDAPSLPGLAPADCFLHTTGQPSWALLQV